MPRLLSVNVGLPRNVPWRGRLVFTSVWKSPVSGRRLVRRLDVDGDAQGDLEGHGGENRAVLVYQIESYPYWEAQLGRGGFTYGQFGENFTVEGLADDEVCIGDQYRIGTALFEVSQPRVTCYRVGIRMEEPRMAALLVAHHRPGFYFRVLEEGEVGAGDQIVRVATGPERMTVAAVDALLYLPGHPAAEVERALRIPALSEGWKGSFRALLAQARGHGPRSGNPGLAPPPSPPLAWAGFRDLRVIERAEESASVFSLLLEAASGGPLPPPEPGQFIVLRLPAVSGQPPLLRSYSLSGLPAPGRYRISIKREAHGLGSSYLFDSANEGAVVAASAPRGTFLLSGADSPVVLLGAGVGATPLLAMLRALAAARSPREVWWLYGARNRAEHPFAAEARDAIAAIPRGHLLVRYSQPGPGDRLGTDFDASGRWTAEAVGSLDLPARAEYFLCGPSGFLTSLAAGLASRGVPLAQLHQEIFGPGPAKTPGIAAAAAPRPQAIAGGAGPLVAFARSGVTAAWDPRFHSVLELAEACDVPVRWACRTGVCRTCETGLIAGAVNYAPQPVEPPAEGDILICCSQPRGALTLDL